MTTTNLFGLGPLPLATGRRHFMYKLILLLICACGFIACDRVEIPDIDRTAPTLSLQLGGANAIYDDDGSMVEGPIDFDRHPTVQTGQGNVSFAVLAIAQDEESGIETLSGTLTVTGLCNYSFFGEVSDPINFRLSKRQDPALDEDGYASVGGLVVFNISPTGIWRSSRCHLYSQANGRARATLTDLSVRYNLYSKNNKGVEITQAGGFDIERLVVDIPELPQ